MPDVRACMGHLPACAACLGLPGTERAACPPLAGLVRHTRTDLLAGRVGKSAVRIGQSAPYGEARSKSRPESPRLVRTEVPCEEALLLNGWTVACHQHWFFGCNTHPRQELVQSSKWLAHAGTCRSHVYPYAIGGRPRETPCWVGGWRMGWRSMTSLLEERTPLPGEGACGTTPSTHDARKPRLGQTVQGTEHSFTAELRTCGDAHAHPHAGCLRNLAAYPHSTPHDP